MCTRVIARARVSLRGGTLTPTHPRTHRFDGENDGEMTVENIITFIKKHSQADYNDLSHTVKAPFIKGEL